MNTPEIYADAVTAFSVSTDGSVAKIVLSSQRPDLAGSIVEHPVLILTMPIPKMQDMLTEIAAATNPKHSAANRN